MALGPGTRQLLETIANELDRTLDPEASVPAIKGAITKALKKYDLAKPEPKQFVLDILLTGAAPHDL